MAKKMVALLLSGSSLHTKLEKHGMLEYTKTLHIESNTPVSSIGEQIKQVESHFVLVYFKDPTDFDSIKVEQLALPGDIECFKYENKKEGTVRVQRALSKHASLRAFLDE